MKNKFFNYFCKSKYDDFIIFEREFYDQLYELKIVRNNRCEMSYTELQFLLSLIQKIKPVKMLEVGVAAGGTTAMILDLLPAKSTLYSVDINKQYYRDKEKPTGYVALDYYDERKHPWWRHFFGLDISECINDIGDCIDFLLLDTVHTLPGEFLSFLVALPFLKDNSLLVLHDICLHTIYYMQNPPKTSTSYCNLLLFSSLSSNKKLLLPNEMSNIAAVFIDKKQVLRNIDIVLHMLSLRWSYFPREDILDNTRSFLVAFYPKRVVDIYDAAVRFNRESFKQNK